MNKAVLLPNLVEYPSASMKRYASDLFAALQEGNTPDWEFEALECHQVEKAIKLLPPKYGYTVASRLGRFVRYPGMAARAAADPQTCALHVLDHSHVNLVLSLPRKKAVVTCHDIIPYLGALGVIPVTYGRLTPYTFPQRIRLMKQCRMIIAVSESTKRNLVEYAGVPEEKISVVYSGVSRAFQPSRLSGDDAGKRRRELLAQHQIPEDAKVIMHVGSGTRYKNTPAIFRALARLREEKQLGDNVYFVRAGSGFYADEEALAEELKIRDRIVLTGRLEGDEALADYYRAADVFVFPSIWEGFGWPPLEAMACGTPVVTSNVASLPEVVGDGGITVGPNDLDGFTDAILRILTQDDLAATLREKALAHASKFTWKRCAVDTLAVYKKMAA